MMTATIDITFSTLIRAAIGDIAHLLDEEYTVANMIEAINVIGAIDLAVQCVLRNPKYAAFSEFEADVVHEAIFDRYQLKMA
ncbi:hypothetical protein K9U39_03635 [Rhodoblastus acidophilus]|uniref:Uncharacterized protein n=1 Tax=Candidatus Rhodoblastus alkanivorans TaxID=2954117 RepID=A0ABS9Z6C6_9HYPH|nr:hypothetical protein [Candidatus Rhodoblastus alkanivorans]MCI4680269.1 hypothetical protein [Candidatus Rhodoblastus alkanivorans]MCI4682742.1 hypothetical protein [Candidatus Rhodoblastus alkanivorans]MDI4640049.1 hypothetical protein [Rhodoblastus acidophilus]